MKRYNPRCRANWIYTTRYFPAFVSALPSRAVVISVISPHVRPFLSFSRLRPSLGRICILYHPPRHADEFCVAPLTRISTSLSAQSGTDKDHGTTPPPPPDSSNFLKLFLSVISARRFLSPQDGQPRHTLFPSLLIYFPAFSKLDSLNHSATGLIYFPVLSTERKKRGMPCSPIIF